MVVVAKAPVAGFAKTRLCPPARPDQAAEIAAASLLDTLHTVRSTPGAQPVVAVSGEPGEAARGDDLVAALAGLPVIDQGEGDLATRLAHTLAHTAELYPGLGVLLIGMDTPQVSPGLLSGAAANLLDPDIDGVLGPASDGGWWLLGLREPGYRPGVQALRDTPMSRPDTGEQTLRALKGVDLNLATLGELSDVDTMDDAHAVADEVPGSRFAHAVATVADEAHRGDGPVSTGLTSAFDHGLHSHQCWMQRTTGEYRELPVDRWHHAHPDAGDELMLARCTGATLDIGCGPGRLAAALTRRGVDTLGVDTSQVAVELATRRGAPAARHDVFGDLPGAGHWKHALLADGNIGIGGDPTALLQRIANLLDPAGTMLIEVEPHGRSLRSELIRITGPSSHSDWFRWAWLGIDALPDTAHHAGLHITWLGTHNNRWFAELAKN